MSSNKRARLSVSDEQATDKPRLTKACTPLPVCWNAIQSLEN